MADSNCSTDDEHTYLLSSTESEDTIEIKERKQKKRIKVKYRFKWLVSSKHAILVLVMVTLAHTFDPVVVISLSGFSNEDDDILFSIYSGLSFLFYLFYPIIGMYADIKFGRYRVGLTALVVALFSSVFMVIGTILARFEINMTSGFVVFSIGFVIGNLARTSFIIVMISYGVDQLLGASGEQLSAFIQWYYWCLIFGWTITVPLSCLLQDVDRSIFIANGLHIACILLAILLFVSCKMIREPRSKINPMSWIFKILKYAKKNKYPSNRSSLTYWISDYPSRLDLGKEKYGGPFSEEQVEDVKTLLRIVPLLVCMVVVFILIDEINPYHYVEHNGEIYSECVISSVHFITGSVMLLTMLLFQTILYPLFYKCFPSMLKRIGLGIFLAILTQVAWLMVDLVATEFGNSNTTCILNIPSNSTAQWDINYQWILVPKIIMGLAYGTAVPTTLEFVFAQAPYALRGVVVGVWFMATGCFKCIGFGMHFPFKMIENARPSCEFYLFLTKLLIIGLSIFCYILLSYWYKLRLRDDTFNQHHVVEQYYEKDLQRRDEYKSEDRYLYYNDYDYHQFLKRVGDFSTS